MYLLAGLLLEPGDEVVSILRECKEVRPFCPGAQTYLALLQTTESHLGAGNVLLGVLEVLKLVAVSACPLFGSFAAPYQCALFPCDTLLLVGVGV